MAKKAIKYTCKNCRKVVTKIGVTSSCIQTYHLGSDSYTDLEVGETDHGFCIECGGELPTKDFKRLIGLNN
jgi:hypothetical protein